VNLHGTDNVILLTRLGNGMQIAVNPDLIERAEHTPDTVITLVDGHKLVVEEPLSEVVRLIRNWRASIAAEAVTMARVSAQDAPHTSKLGERPDATAEMETAAMLDQSAHGSPLGRVLRLPSREV
jgi:flagellar protein FlbD